MDFLGGNDPLDLGQVQNSKFKHAPFQKARYPRKKIINNQFMKKEIR